jgi:hypothetical protein
MKRFLVFLSAAFLALPVHAVIIASGDGTGNTQAPAHDPGFANVGTIGSLSAVYLGNRWVLTANHVGVGVVFFEGVPYTPLLDTVHELVSLQGASYPAPDLVLFQIAEDPGLPNLHIAETTPEAGASLVMIGHGRNRGEPVVGADGILGWSWGQGHAMRWGTNQLRSSGFEISSNGWRTSVFSTDFSRDGTEFEAHGSSGDSGGAVYSGDHELAGLMLALGPFFRPPDPALFGNYTYAADLARYRDQILAITGPPPTCEVELDKTCCISPQSGPGLFGETTCRPTGGTTGDDCQGKVLEMVFEYTGGNCTATTNFQEGKAKCEGGTGGATAAIVPDKSSIKANPSLVGVGETFRVRQKDGKDLGSTFKVEVIGSGTQKLEIHTSCSKDLNVGDQFGSLRLVELTTTEGGTVTEAITPVEFLDICELPEAPPAPHCTTKVMALTLRYTGEGCSATTNTQEGKAKCSGDTGGSPVEVVITKDDDKIAVDGVIGGTGSFAVGDTFEVTNLEDYPDPKELKASTKLRLDGRGGSQELTIHTSCSKQLDLGDRFGALEVVALDRKDRGLISLGGTVEYQYKVTSPLSNTGPISVAVEDDPDVDDGDSTTVEIGSGITLDPGQEVTLFWARELSETTTNRATATALTDSLMCEAVDEVTVEMVPAGGVESFD